MRLVISALVLALMATTVSAADMSPPPQMGASDPLAQARKLIKQKNWAGALTELRAAPLDGDPDWNNLMGYSLRKQASPDLATAERHYLQALRLDPGHKGANEYLGELYLMKGDVPSARARLAVLERICPSGCEERSDLQRSIEKAGK
jgi:Flp pilus assembly protein TadD